MKTRGALILACSALAGCFRAGAGEPCLVRESGPVPADGAGADRRRDARDQSPLGERREGPPPCPPGGFTPPEAVVELNSPADDANPTLPADELEIFFSSTRPGGPGGKNIWVARRASANLAFDPPTLAAAVNAVAESSDAEISADGLTLFLSSDRPNGGWGHIYVATRPSRGVPFSAPTAVAALNSSKGDYDPSLSADGLTIYLSSSRPDGNDNNIWVATRSTLSDSFSTPVLLPGLVNSQYGEQDPAISTDRLALLFTSTGRPGGTGASDIWISRRADAAKPFEAPVLAATLSGGGMSAFLTRNGKSVYLASSRGAESGAMDIYRAHLCPP